MSTATGILVTAMTHRGLVRDRNEDTIGVGAWLRNAAMEAPEQFVHATDAPLVCLVADGMGGHAAGDEASRIAVAHLARCLPGAADQVALAEGIAAAHHAIVGAMDDDPALEGMGTTLVGLVVRPDGSLSFNVGDSRLYRVRDGFVRQISTDDVPDAGWRSDDLPVAARSGVLTQCLGGRRPGQPPTPHLGTEPLEDGWVYLLCSDGLTDLVTYGRMADILTDRSSDLEKVRLLVQEAIDHGGTDNVSVMLVRLRSDAAGEGTP